MIRADLEHGQREASFGDPLNSSRLTGCSIQGLGFRVKLAMEILSSYEVAIPKAPCTHIVGT